MVSVLLKKVAFCFLLCYPVLTACVQASEKEVSDSPTESSEEKVATLAGGCFWCLEAVFERMIGVNDVISGYTGDETVRNPTYALIGTKQTMHAEAVQIYYDPSVITYTDLLEVFFTIHDPTTPNQQGADIGPQYRSVIFYHDDQQKAEAEAMISKLTQKQYFRAPIVTELTQLGTWWDAEEYHQDYFRRNPRQGYCRAVVASKVRKFNNVFKDKVRKDGVGSRP